MLRSRPDVSQAVGTRLFRKAGGMPPAMFRSSAKPLSGGISRWRSARRSRFSMRRGIPCGRLGGASDGLPRQSPVSWIAMQPPTAARWPIGRRPLSGMQIDRPAAPSRPSLRATPPCALMWKTGLPVSSRPQAALAFVGQARARIGDGRKPGAPSRLPDACRSTSRMTRRCASATKLFIKPFSFRAVERCAVS